MGLGVIGVDTVAITDFADFVCEVGHGGEKDFLKKYGFAMLMEGVFVYMNGVPKVLGVLPDFGMVRRWSPARSQWPTPRCTLPSGRVACISRGMACPGAAAPPSTPRRAGAGRITLPGMLLAGGPRYGRRRFRPADSCLIPAHASARLHCERGVGVVVH